ncbi:MAG: hypothetical protein QXR53_02090 [Candidatus Norongarragalinales archaeon]
MANPLVNAFTVAAFAFTLFGVIKPADFMLVVLMSMIVTRAAPTFHKKH